MPAGAGEAFDAMIMPSAVENTPAKIVQCFSFQTRIHNVFVILAKNAKRWNDASIILLSQKVPKFLA